MYKNQQGYTIIELTILLMIVGSMFAGGLLFYAAYHFAKKCW